MRSSSGRDLRDCNRDSSNRFPWTSSGIVRGWFFCLILFLPDSSYSQEFPDVVHFNRLSTQDGLSFNHISQILQDSQGYIWIGTLNGLNRFDGYSVETYYYDPASGVFTRYQLDPQNPNSISSNKITVIQEDSSGNIWIGTLKGGLNRFDPSNESFNHYPIGNPIHDIISFWIDRHDILWIGTWGGGMFRLDSRDSSMKQFIPKTDKGNTISSRIIQAIYEDDSGLFWIGTQESGIQLFHPKTEAFRSIKKIWWDSRSISSNTVLNIYADPSGILWFGTSDAGVCWYDPNNLCFEHIHQNMEPNGLTENYVRALIVDHLGQLWIGTKGGGLNQYDPMSKQYRHYMHDPENPASLPSNTVTSLLETRDGKLWVACFGSDNKPLSQFDWETKQFKSFSDNPECPDSFHGRIIRSFCEDHHGEIWIGTEKCGINVFNPQTGKFRHYRKTIGDPNWLHSDHILCIYNDRKNIIWIGTKYGDFHRYNRGQDTFTAYRIQHDAPVHDIKDEIRCIRDDLDGNLWLATNRGLFRFDPEKELLKRYTTVDGLANGSIRGIEIDRHGAIWCSTDRGMSRLDVQRGTIHNFDLESGVQGFYFSNNCNAVGRNGEMYFGGSNGFNRFRPERFRENTRIPPIVFTSFQVMGKPHPFRKAYSSGEIIKLNYKQNFLTFGFAALNFTQSFKNRYQYRLQEIETDWNESRTNRIAHYTTLAPGKYVFQVRGSNNHGVWNQQGASLAFFIQPPFWGTWWFRIGMMVLFIGTLFVLFYLRVRHIQADKRRLASEVASRTKELRTERDRSNTIIRSSPVVIFVFNPQGEITFLNPAGESLLGWPMEEMRGKKFWEIVEPEKERRLFQKIYQEIQIRENPGGHVYDREMTLTIRNGEVRTMVWNFINHFGESGQLCDTLAFGNDITERLAKEILEVSAREQRKIGREIHDSFCQSLTGITFMFETLAQKSREANSDDAELNERILDYLKNITAQSKRLSRGLYLYELENQGLVPALRELASNFQNLFGIRCNFACHEQIGVNDINVATHIYRVAQEALSNAMKYSEADRTELILKKENQQLRLIVRDNGIGFVPSSSRQKGMGLHIMLHRTRMIHGKLDINSQPGKGTEIICLAPLPS